MKKMKFVLLSTLNIVNSSVPLTKTVAYGINTKIKKKTLKVVQFCKVNFKIQTKNVDCFEICSSFRVSFTFMDGFKKLLTI